MDNTNEFDSVMFSFLTLAKFMGVQAKQADLIRIMENTSIDEGEVL